MITFSKLGRHGQLGNQLFAYAMLLGVQAKHGYEIAIPKNYDGKKKRGLVELSKFNISAEDYNPICVYTDYQEPHFEFSSSVWEQPDYTNYNGYFQSEKYFEHCIENIRNEFRFISDIDIYANRFVRSHKQNGQKLISMHVRRGDYLEHPELFHVLTPEYYQAAINKMLMHFIDSYKLYVFSDDIRWCEKNLGFSNAVFVKSPSHWHDMCIMSKCDAHIISASTFAWWGAWLSKSDYVIAPEPWFPDGPRNSWNQQDIAPARWARQAV